MALAKVQRTPGSRGVNQTPRSRAFLLELLLNIIIFAVCALVALHVFVEGRRSIEESAALTQITLDAQSLAESYKVSTGEPLTLELEGARGVLGKDGSLTYYYNSALEYSGADEARYTLLLTTVEGVSSLVDVIEIAGYDTNTDEMLLTFKVTRYQPQGGR